MIFNTKEHGAIKIRPGYVVLWNLETDKEAIVNFVDIEIFDKHYVFETKYIDLNTKLRQILDCDKSFYEPDGTVYESIDDFLDYWKDTESGSNACILEIKIID